MPAHHQVYLSLGTNLGDRLDNLRQAWRALSEKFELPRSSSIYETEPWGFADQPSFLNMVVCGQTDLNPQELLDFLKGLEQELGRQPTFRYGPRKIDLDILFFDDLVTRSEKLEIPHPRLAERAFVLVPLAELAPGLVHPVSGLSVEQLLQSVDSGSVKFVQEFSPQNTQKTQKKELQQPGKNSQR